MGQGCLKRPLLRRPVLIINLFDGFVVEQVCCIKILGEA